MVLACADGNASLTTLVWTTWNLTTASATGIYNLNDCVPDCAEGTFGHYAALVELTAPVSTVHGLRFTELAVQPQNPSEFSPLTRPIP
jgi:hypothetical protein